MRTRRCAAWGVCAATTLGILLGACGSSKRGYQDSQEPEQQPEAGGGGDAGRGPTFDPGEAGQGADTGDPSRCATDRVEAAIVPLALYFMLDSSGSMTERVAPTTSKWKAITGALRSFFDDAQSSGMSVGLQYFPRLGAGQPTSCKSGADCPGATGPCTAKACAADALRACETDADCPWGGCAPRGGCSAETDWPCTNLGGSCGFDEYTGWTLGDCVALAAYRCAAGDSCEPGDYRAPEVAFGALTGPGGAHSAALGSWLDTHEPAGRTPTIAALDGAVGAAKDYQADHPAERVAVVFATDGEPTVCDTDMGHISKVAHDAFTATGLQSFVIGVFSPAEQSSAQASLDQIAAAGGTKKAFIVTTTDTATQQFLKALNEVRGSLPCEYAIPVPTNGQPDFGKVNVEYTAKGQAPEQLGFVATPADCGTAGGWTYAVDPVTKTPTKIVLCPASCERVRGGEGGAVDVVLGCQTATTR